MLRSSSSKSLMHQAQIKVEHSDSGLRLSVGLEDLVLGSSVDSGSARRPSIAVGISHYDDAKITLRQRVLWGFCG